MPTPARNVTSPDETILPSETTRAIVSFVLIVHMVAVLVGLSAVASPGHSQLVDNLYTKIYRPYLTTTWLATPYEYVWSSAGWADVGAVASVAYTDAEGNAKTLLVPDMQNHQAVRQQQLQKLLNRAAVNFIQDGEGSITGGQVMRLVAMEIARLTGAKKATVTFLVPGTREVDLDKIKELMEQAPAERNIRGQGNAYEVLATFDISNPTNKMEDLTMQSASDVSERAPSSRPRTTNPPSGK